MSETSLFLPNTPILISLRSQFANTKPKPIVDAQQRENGFVTNCICGNSECNDIQRKLQERGDLWFGTTTLDYNETNIQAKQYAEHVFDAFGLNKDFFQTDKEARFHVARHHWTRQLVALHDEYPFRWEGTLMSEEDAEAYLYKPLPSNRCPSTDQGYFQTPDYPIELVKKFILDYLSDKQMAAAGSQAEANEEYLKNAARNIDEWQAMTTLQNLEINLLRRDKLELQAMLNKAKVRQEALQASNIKIKQERNEAVRLFKRQKLAHSGKPLKGMQAGNAEQHPCSVQTFYDFICCSGGLSRMSLSNDDWHFKHPKAGLHLFGYKTWQECKVDIKMRFPDLILERPSMTRRKNGKLELDTPTEFEKCLCMKMYSRTKLSRQRLGLIWGLDDTTITRYRKTWGKSWEDLGFKLPEYTGLKTKEVKLNNLEKNLKFI